MSKTVNDLLASLDKGQEESLKVMERVFAAAQPGAVFGEPVVSGDYTLITASEVSAGGGYGFGKGWGRGPESAAPGSNDQAQESPGGAGGAGGGGGGGGSSGRPVAVIVIGPEGVRIRPVVDITKLAIAGITAWGAMGVMMSRMRRPRKN